MAIESLQYHSPRHRGVRHFDHYQSLKTFQPEKHMPANVTVLQISSPRPKGAPVVSANPVSSAPKPQPLPSVVLEFPVPTPRAEARLENQIKTTLQAAHRSTTRPHPRSAQGGERPNFAFNMVTHQAPPGITEGDKLTIITVHRSAVPGAPDPALALVASFQQAQRNDASLHRRQTGLDLTPR